MDRVSCRAIVPYVSKPEKRSFLYQAYDSRKRLYVFSFVFVSCVTYASFLFCLRYDISFIDGPLASGSLFYAHFKFILLLFLTGFTVFSPASYVLSLCVYSFYCGNALIICSGINERFTVALFLFVSVIYFCELCLCFERTKYGIKQIFSAYGVFVFSVKTLAYIAFSLFIFHL